MRDKHDNNPFLATEPCWYRFNDARTSVFVDIMLNGYREVFNEWDFSPAMNRDLDDDLFEFLETCVTEIPEKPKLNIVFHLPLATANAEQERGCTLGMRNYFRYQLRRENLRMRMTWGNAAYYGVFGLLFLIAAPQVSNYLTHDWRFIAEGFSIGGWVLFWELFSIIFFQVREHRMALRRLNRLLNASIKYIYSDEPSADADDGSDEDEESLFDQKKDLARLLQNPPPDPSPDGPTLSSK